MRSKFLALLFFPVAIFAQGEIVDFKNPNSVITWLMPFITFGVTWLVKKISPAITGTITLLVVPLVSTGIAYLGTIIEPDSSWLVSALVGLGSVFLNQFYREITK